MDSYGDGLTSCSAANGGAGSYQILFNGDVLAEITEAQANFGSSNTKNFCIQDNSSLEENDLNSLISVYPNPANEMINIVSNGLTVEKAELLNIAGQVIAKQTENAPIVKLNVSGVASGVYLVKVYAAEGTSTKQIVIK